jgi:hypothetical protein
MNTRRGKPTRREQGLLVHVRRAQARNVPLTQYCRANGLNVQSLYNLRSRLARIGKLPRQPVPKKRKPVSPFVAVRVAAAPVVPASAACRLQIKGWVIECASLPSPEWLGGLMAGDTHAVP